MVAIEERVHPTPFRTRKLSSPSPMILHNVMWESRPLPKIVRDPLAAHSARGSFFVPAPPGIFLFGGRQADAWRCEEGKSLRGGKPFGEKVLPPRTPPFQKLLPVGLCKDFSACIPCKRVESPSAFPGSARCPFSLSHQQIMAPSLVRTGVQCGSGQQTSF